MTFLKGVSVPIKTQRVSQGAALVGARGFIQNTWSLNAPPFGGDTVLNLSNPQNPTVLVDGWYSVQFITGGIDGAGPVIATPGSLWSPALSAGPLAVEQNEYIITPAADVALFGPQFAKCIAIGTLHAGAVIQTFITNGDTAAHTWGGSDLYVSVYPPHVLFLN